MQQPGFIFGGNTDWSYDELQRKRQIAENLRMANMRTPQNVGEGLSAIGRALAARKLETQSGKRDAELREEFNRKWGALLGGGVGGSPAPQGPVPGQPVTSAPVVPANPNDPAGIAGDAMVALGKAPDADMIRAKLVERGLPPAVAEGFVMNFKDESGLNPGINEIAPTVPGSRGGFGLAQWTGPRRVALEKFAAERGVPVDNVDVQLDFLMTELQGPEAGAWGKISGAQDPGTAAAAIATHFLRPAEEHLDRRVAEYTGGQQGGMDPMVMADLMGSPYASEGQKAILSALLNQQLQAADPMQQLALEKARLELDALRNPQADPMQSIELQKAQLELEQMRNPQVDQPTSVKEYQFYTTQSVASGEQPLPYDEWITQKAKAGATNVNVGGEGNSGAILAETKMDPATMVADIDAILGDVNLDRVVGPLEGGGGNDVDTFGAAKRAYYGGEGLGLIQRIGQLQGTTFLAARQMLKGGGGITDFESKKAEGAIARLSRAQSEEGFRAALKDLRDAIEAGAAKLQQGAPTSAAPAAPQPGTRLKFNPATGELE